MLAEAWEPELMKNAFDMGYSWDTHHRMNHIAKGEENVKNCLDSIAEEMGEIDILINKYNFFFRR